MSSLTRRRLRTMRNRWQRDYETLLASYGDWSPEDAQPLTETMRNLATAIAEIDGIIVERRRGDK
jgi:hypothetical protein